MQQWRRQTLQSGSVGVVIRVKGDDDLQAIEPLPKDGKRYEQGNLVILNFAQEAS